MTTRTQQIGSIVHRALALQMLPFETEHGLITISEVIVSPDLADARVFVDAERGCGKLVEKLNTRARVLKREIASQFTQKRSPRLQFLVDTGAAHLKKIEKLLEE
jgi:ribosome-binding factor A